MTEREPTPHEQAHAALDEVLAWHMPLGSVSDPRPGRAGTTAYCWTVDLCSCGWRGEDYDEHLGAELAARLSLIEW